MRKNANQLGGLVFGCVDIYKQLHRILTDVNLICENVLTSLAGLFFGCVSKVIIILRRKRNAVSFAEEMKGTLILRN